MTLRYLATGLVTLLLPLPALSVELFRYRGAAKDGGTLEYVFEAGEQNSPDAVTKEKAAEIAADFMTTFYHVQVGALETQEFRTMPVPFWLINAGASQPAQQSPYRCVCGGCLPRCASSPRITKASGRFMCSAMTVARPVDVIPTTRTPSQRKCTRHTSRRGSNNTASSPVCGSTQTKRALFLSEHETQASARFSEVDCPPATTGTTWSTWKVASWPV